jgi:hypothetical protein
MSFLPLKVSSLQTKELHVQNKLVFSNPFVALTGSNTSLLFDRVENLEQEVGELYSNGVNATQVSYPSLTSNSYEGLTSQLLLGQTLTDQPYNTFGRFAFPATDSQLLDEVYSLPNAVPLTHFRIFNETDMSIFPLTVFLVVECTNTDATVQRVSISSEVVSFRNTGTWSFYSGA